MNEERTNMLSIGSFAQATNLSQKALRLYAKLALLEPEWVDPLNGYRFYAREQLAPARMIAMLRQMAMPLATVRRVLAAPAPQAAALVQMFVREQVEQLRITHKMASGVIAALYREVPMTFDVYVESVADQPVLALTQHVHVAQLEATISASLAQLNSAVAGQQLAPVGVPFGIFMGPINHQENGPIQICLPLAAVASVGVPLESFVLPGGRAACVMMRDDQCVFPTILGGYDAVFDWVNRQGFKPAAASREIWHSPTQMEIVLLFSE